MLGKISARQINLIYKFHLIYSHLFAIIVSPTTNIFINWKTMNKPWLIFYTNLQLVFHLRSLLTCYVFSPLKNHCTVCGYRYIFSIEKTKRLEFLQHYSNYLFISTIIFPECLNIDHRVDYTSLVDLPNSSDSLILRIWTNSFSKKKIIIMS